MKVSSISIRKSNYLSKKAFLNLGSMLFTCTIQLIPSMRLRLSRFVVVNCVLCTRSFSVSRQLHMKTRPRKNISRFLNAHY